MKKLKVKLKMFFINIKIRIEIIKYSRKQSKKVYKETKKMLMDIFKKKSV